MKEILVYSAIFGGKDRLFNNQFKIPEADYVMFSDNPEIKSDIWKIKIINNNRFRPHRLSRYYKLLPHRHFPEYKYSLWIDGNRTLLKDMYRFMKEYMEPFNKMALPIPSLSCWKKDAYDEAAHCIKIGKDMADTINRQTDYYRKEGLPQGSGLWGCQFMLREHNDPDCKVLHELWWEHLKTFSKRDQISFPYCVWVTGMIPAGIPAKKFKGYVRTCKHVK